MVVVIRLLSAFTRKLFILFWKLFLFEKNRTTGFTDFTSTKAIPGAHHHDAGMT